MNQQQPVLDLVIETFPMMQQRHGYWWYVHDSAGHILKLGRANSETEAQAAASTWLRGLAGEVQK